MQHVRMHQWRSRVLYQEELQEKSNEEGFVQGLRVGIQASGVQTYELPQNVRFQQQSSPVVVHWWIPQVC
jgi:hypothetical protein